MSRSHSPLSRSGGGWSSPESNRYGMTPSGSSSPGRADGQQVKDGARGVTWASTPVRSEGVNGYPSFFGRHYRRLSESLPQFHIAGRGRNYAEKEKLGRGRWFPARGNFGSNLITYAGRILRRMRLRFLLVLMFLLFTVLFYVTRESPPGNERFCDG